MEWLDGHPLSMRLILTRLDTTDPEMLLACTGDARRIRFPSCRN
jgi:hypothetical protein